MRLETDAFGTVAVPHDRLWGAQTQRALALFSIGAERFPSTLIRTFGLQKLASARANRQLNTLTTQQADLIESAAMTLWQNDLSEHFPLTIWQTGSGTQTNMNANEVIANLANQQAGHPPGTRHPIHPNNHVNASQSSNDSFPTVMHLCTVTALHEQLIPALATLETALLARSQAFGSQLKLARTHLMDAVPTSMGNTFRAYARQVALSTERIRQAIPALYALAQGGTAAGTGLNAPTGFDAAFCAILADLTGFPYVPSPCKVEGMAAHDALVNVSAALSGLAVSLTKIANDIRWMGSGPRSGLNELHIPHDGLTSSIMPGKRNPTIAEAMLQISQQVMGNHHTVSLAGASGNFELNVAKPVLIYNLLQSINLLADGMRLFSSGLIDGLTVNQEQLDANLENALLTATALVPSIGYDNAAQVTSYALENHVSVRCAAMTLGFLTAGDYDRLIDMQRLAMPHGNAY